MMDDDSVESMEPMEKVPLKGLGESELVTLSVSINQHSRYSVTVSLFHRQRSDSIIKRLERNLASPTTLAIQARQYCSVAA